jgi:hypothetical protein
MAIEQFIANAKTLHAYASFLGWDESFFVPYWTPIYSGLFTEANRERFSACMCA